MSIRHILTSSAFYITGVLSICSIYWRNDQNKFNTEHIKKSEKGWRLWLGITFFVWAGRQKQKQASQLIFRNNVFFWIWEMLFCFHWSLENICLLDDLKCSPMNAATMSLIQPQLDVRWCLAIRPCWSSLTPGIPLTLTVTFRWARHEERLPYINPWGRHHHRLTCLRSHR